MGRLIVPRDWSSGRIRARFGFREETGRIEAARGAGSGSVGLRVYVSVIKAQQLLARGASVASIARELGVSRSTLQRALKKWSSRTPVPNPRIFSLARGSSCLPSIGDLWAARAGSHCRFVRSKIRC